ncbi:MAG: GAF domain-containing protein, partial [Okeania sp. SIO2D1]|nr:GAF domain-containing protein [Okeania sp. SIO2D1]
LDLLNTIESKEFYAKTIEIVCLSVKHWKEHINSTLKLLIDGYKIGLESGDFESASFAAYDYCAHSFVLGKNLIELEREMFSYGLVIEGLQQKMVFNLNALHRQTVLNLIEINNNPSFLQGKAYDQEKMLPIHQQDNDFSSLALFYIDKLFLCYLFGDRLQATEIGNQVESYLEGIPGQVFVPIFYLYDALSWLSLYPELEKTDREIAMLRISSHQTKMTKWADHAPMNYAHKLYLINAEKHRVLGEKIRAIEMYDLAIALAQENEYLQEEALANELAAKFYLEWGKEKFAAIYMEQAYYCYASWGAKAKTKQLEKQYPQLLTPILKPQQLEFNPFESWENFTQTFSSTIQEQTSTSTKLSETLDLASILQATHAISSTIELEQLLSDIVEIILTNAGAQKTALLTFQADQWQIQAMAEVATDGTVETLKKSFPVNIESIVPTRLIQYVKNTQESILINESQTDIPGILEGYLLEYQPQSILCIPLLYQSNLVGILYLEHPTTKGVFTSYRQTIVQFLCTQAAISLQNAQLYDQATQALQDLKAAQLQIVQSEKMSALGNLMAGVAHEINGVAQ